MIRPLLRLFLPLTALIAAPLSAQKLDRTPRTAIMTAFPPERAALEAAITQRRDRKVNGITVTLGKLRGKPVLLVESGVSMVNAAMTTQWLIDRFRLRRIVFSGIAGGVDPALHIGDVVVADSWSQSMETTLARETPQGGYAPVFRTPGNDLPNFGMMFPRDVGVGNASHPMGWHRAFAADPALLALATRVAATVRLQRCIDASTSQCLGHDPQVHVGGRGVSAPAFLDNAPYRQYLHATFGARVADMESAAVAQVAYANAMPFIAFRSLSDLAGGDAESNQMGVFMALASANSAHVVEDFVAALPN
jgi:adenosylhomocysteine nucleosidase